MKKTFIVILMVCLISILDSPLQAMFPKPEYAPALVIREIGRTELSEGHIQELQVKILRGKLKGKEYPAQNRVWAEQGYNVMADTGRKVIVQIKNGESGLLIYVSGKYRAPYTFAAVILFILVFAYVSGKEFFRGILSVSINVLLILFALLPMIRAGYPPVATTLFLCAIGIAISVRLILGGGEKFISASLGAFAGVVAAAIMTSFFSEYMDIAGLFSEGSRLLYTASHRLAGWGVTDLPGLDSAGIMVAALGSVVDVSVSIASACFSVAEEVDSRMSIWQSGLAVGRDIIATMLNSLVLVFFSAALPLMLVFQAADIPFIVAGNYDMLVILITGAVIASSGLVISVPATAAVSAWRGYRR
ncbi:MAG: hypothetical protein GX817_01365 [Elusimicrobia bacterium]|nr:hypothetical protein [Elusimicrobiota bacterium]